MFCPHLDSQGSPGLFQRAFWCKGKGGMEDGEKALWSSGLPSQGRSCLTCRNTET